MSATFYSLILFLFLCHSEGALKRCFTCRSRGDLGTCKDPFVFNVTSSEKQHGIEHIPCASGWCSKIIEGRSTFSASEYGMATERQCLPRGPSDNEERCDYTTWKHKKVYMCFCRGDLCNAALINKSTTFLFIVPLFLYLIY